MIEPRKRGGGALSTAERLAVAAWPVCAIRWNCSVKPWRNRVSGTDRGESGNVISELSIFDGMAIRDANGEGVALSAGPKEPRAVPGSVGCAAITLRALTGAGGKCRRSPLIRLGIVLALVAVTSCRTPESVPWVQRFPLLTSYEYPLVDSLWVLARDSFPEIPVERVNRILGREPSAPIKVRFGHFSGYIELGDGRVVFGHASYHLWAGGEVCVWHDEILPREQAVFESCFKHTVGISPGYEIDVVVSGYRPREDFEYVKLREVHVRVPPEYEAASPRHRLIDEYRGDGN